MKAHRVISRLHWAKALQSKPDCIPTARVRGAKAAGLRYERALARHLPESAHGVWFEYNDENGHGYCQPDLLFSFLPDFVAILEVKYTLVLDAFSKLHDLYIPVISLAMNAPAVGVVVVRNLTPGIKDVHRDLASAALASYEAQYPTILHWRDQNLLLDHQSAQRAKADIQPARAFTREQSGAAVQKRGTVAYAPSPSNNIISLNTRRTERTTHG
jgi:hypothetical protein